VPSESRAGVVDARETDADLLVHEQAAELHAVDREGRGEADDGADQGLDGDTRAEGEDVGAGGRVLVLGERGVHGYAEGEDQHRFRAGRDEGATEDRREDEEPAQARDHEQEGRDVGVEEF
jgi:hypothetical protein